MRSTPYRPSALPCPGSLSASISVHLRLKKTGCQFPVVGYRLRPFAPFFVLLVSFVVEKEPVCSAHPTKSALIGEICG